MQLHMRPERPYRLLRAIAGTVILFAYVGMWAYMQYIDKAMQFAGLTGMLTAVLVAAAAIAVFGEGTLFSAVDAVKEAKSAVEDGEE